MGRRFAAFTLDEFGDLLDRFAFSRRIDAVHLHHTWRPNHSQWREEASVLAMWRFHTETNGWSDIAQHVTIAPDGKIWEGRNWNARPASASGHNGGDTAGPFMFETVGDFDLGHDALSGPQRAAVVGVIARLQEHFGLGPESLRLHREMTSLKSCPGTSVKLDEIRAEVAAAREALDGANPRGRASVPGAGRPTRGKAVRRRLPRLRAVALGSDPADAEPAESLMAEEQWRKLIVEPAPKRRRAATKRGRAATKRGRAAPKRGRRAPKRRAAQRGASKKRSTRAPSGRSKRRG